jgi:hypothetical protein
VPVVAASARVTGPAGEEHLHRDAVAGLDAPPGASGRAGGLDDADDLVTGNERRAGGERAGELLVVRPAQTACLDAQQAVVVAELGPRELPRHQRAR